VKELKNIYLVRHCEAEGQSAEAQLTERGNHQALDLSAFFHSIQVDRIISSPYKRARQSIEPLALCLNLEIENDHRLTERVLSSENLPNWFEKLKATFTDMDLTFEGGESSRAAMKRIVAVTEEVFQSDAINTVIVTHGNIMSLLLKHYQKDVGFTDWCNLSNPDVFLLKYEKHKIICARIWGKDGE